MFAWALTGKHASMGLSWWVMEVTTSQLVTRLNRMNFYSFPLRQGGVEFSFQTLLSFLGVPERGKALGVAKVVWVLQLNRHLSGFQSLKWTAWANPEITEAVSFSKLIKLVWASCCHQPFWVLGLDTKVAQVTSAVPSPKACPGIGVLSVVFILSSHFGYLCNGKQEGFLIILK